MKEQNYHEEVKIKNILRLRELLKELPPFLEDFFRGISDITATRTRIGYAYDIKIFFHFLTEEITYFMGKNTKDITLGDLDKITATDIEVFMEYLTYYVKNEDNITFEYQNNEKGKMRKLAALRTMYNYYFKKEKIETNPSVLVEMPKLHKKAIIRLELDEIALLLDQVESGDNLTDSQKKFHVYNKKRDLAIVSLLLGTGIRISECVGLNTQHVDLSMNAIKITRKGGDESVIYIGDEVAHALELYLQEREKIAALEGHTDALFISLQRKRLTDRAIQLLVKKYSKLVTNFKNITPHKLRSTYGTNLYRETGDIYLVADILGHSDINTTKKHYAEMNEDKRRYAANAIKLRE